MKEFQIRTNAYRRGDGFGVYIFGGTKYEYHKEDRGESYERDGVVYTKDVNYWNKKKFRYGYKADRFVPQEHYNHGTFQMEEQQAKELAEKLNAQMRNGFWVKLYEMI